MSRAVDLINKFQKKNENKAEFLASLRSIQSTIDFAKEKGLDSAAEKLEKAMELAKAAADEIESEFK